MKQETNLFVQIPAVIASLVLFIVIVVLVFAKEYLIHVSSIVWALVVLGIVALLFAYKAVKSGKG